MEYSAKIVDFFNPPLPCSIFLSRNCKNSAISGLKKCRYNSVHHHQICSQICSQSQLAICSIKEKVGGSWLYLGLVIGNLLRIVIVARESLGGGLDWSFLLST